MNSFYHAEVPVYVRLAQVVGISTALGLSGASFSITALTIPPLLKAPAPLLAKQWAILFNKGKNVIPPLALLASLSFGYLAVREWRAGSPALYLYATAGVIAPSFIPYTLVFMNSTNQKLLEKADTLAASDAEEEVKGGQEETTHVLVDRWATLNLVRGVISATAGVLALWASLQPVEVVGIAGFEFVGGADRLG